jgi:two-component system chemotaxis sensor kinase CheA
MEEVTASAEGQRARDEWSRIRQAWDEDVQTLSQVEMEIGAALGQFQEAVLALRARPAADVLEPLHRLVQNVAQYQGKLIELEVQGGDLWLERSALDALAEPVQRLVWLLAVHSIEKPAQRQEAGKPALGRISVAVKQADDRVRVLISDDGLGLSAGEPPVQTPATNGVNDELEAVGAALRARRGRLHVGANGGINGSAHSAQGARLTLDLPLERAVIDGLIVRAGDVYYVLPVGAVRRIVQPEAAQIVHSSADGGQQMVRWEESLAPIQTLVFDKGAYEGALSDQLLLIVERDDQCVALAVDELVGQQQVLIQPLQGCLADVPHISGCALLGEGDVGMVLDLSR